MVDVDGAIRIDRVTFARVAKTLLGVPIGREIGIGKGAKIGALAKTLYYWPNRVLLAVQRGWCYPLHSNTNGRRANT